MIRNVEAEQSVLGSVIQEGDLIKDCQLKVKQFSLPTHQVIFRAMRELEDAEVPMILLLSLENSMKALCIKLAELNSL